MFTTQTEKTAPSQQASGEFLDAHSKKVDYAILSAMPEELEFFKAYFSDCKSENIKVCDFSFMLYEYKSKIVLLASTGIGTAFASTVATLINLHFSPVIILFSGTAGGIHPTLKLRDVVIAERAFEAEIQGVFNTLKGTPFESSLIHPLTNTQFPQIYSADEELLQLMNRIHFPDITIHKGTVVSSNAFPAPKELFEQIKAENAYAIDMETSALYQVGWLLKARVLAVRGVSNVLNQDGTDDAIHESDLKGSSKAAARVLLKLLDALAHQYGLKESNESGVRLALQKEVAALIQKFNLQPHPEGGYYARTFQSMNRIKALDESRYANESRHSGTAIFYLLQARDFSAWHRIKSDEIWHYYKGSSVKIYVLNEQGKLSEYLLGDHLVNPESSFQIAIPAGHWFAAELLDKTSYCLVGCTVTPGFEFRDFELADRIKLTKEFPKHSFIIEQLTRQA